jgi:3-oxoacyl-[acyl-carrier protein] reductase
VRLQGQVALVTAAGGPMGHAIAKRFVREGASVAITDVSGARLNAAAVSIEPQLIGDAQVIAERADVTQATEADGVVKAALAAFGRVDVLVNVVGGIRAKTMFEPLLSISEERWDSTFALNLKGNLHLTKQLAPGMIARRHGKIINISSINFAGEMGSADYGAAKAAVASLTRTMAIEFAPHVNVNCIAPGTIRTRMLERLSADELDFYATKPLLKRLGEPEDIANACLFLASEEASYITGEILSVSGGVWPAL